MSVRQGEAPFDPGCRDTSCVCHDRTCWPVCDEAQTLRQSARYCARCGWHVDLHLAIDTHWQVPA